MKKVIGVVTSTILVVALVAVAMFVATMVTEARYLPYEVVERQVTIDNNSNIRVKEVIQPDWTGSNTEAILIKADNLTGNVFHLADGLY